MHISIFTVREGTDEEWSLIPSGRRPMSGEKGYFLTHLDGNPVTSNVLIPISIRRSNGVPSLVYIDGGWPTYETWVYHNGAIVAHFLGHLSVFEEATP